MKRQTFRANPTIFVAFLIILCLVGIAIPNSFGASKRIAVLYFNDYSQFDSPTGCGCIPSIIGEIFSGKKRLWNLEAGFTSLLNRKLEATGVYEPIPQDEIVGAMKKLDFSRKDVRKKVEVRKSLADQLRADTLVVGSIRKFGQERARANASQSLRGEQQSRRGLNASFLAGVQVLAYVYTARIKLEMQFYGASARMWLRQRLRRTDDTNLAAQNLPNLKQLRQRKVPNSIMDYHHARKENFVLLSGRER